MKTSLQHAFSKRIFFGKGMFFLFLLFSFLFVEAQPFIRDTSFQPVFTVRDYVGKPANLARIIEHPRDSTLFMVGSGGFYTSTRDGDIHPYTTGFPHGGGLSPREVRLLNDSVILISMSGSFHFPLDTSGSMITTGDWGTWSNMYNKTVSCLRNPLYSFFFPNGSSLMVNHSPGNPQGPGLNCKIFNPPDTFPFRHLVKVDSLGFWDSSFVSGADAEAQGFAEYDSSRIWVFGNPRDFTHYDGVPVNGLCRIYHDGRLDTTFTSPFQSPSSFSPQPPIKVEKDGKFFIKGPVHLKDSGQIWSSLVRCNADGSLDSTFTTHGGPFDTTLSRGSANSIVSMDDGGYLVGGSFNKYRGQPVNSIMKIDSLGNLEPQYFTSLGPDSGTTLSSLGRFHGVRQILPSKFGGYYVIGDWQKWDGQLSQPIVRLIDSATLVGLAKQKPESAIFNFSIFPNPATEEIVLQLEQPTAVQQIELYDLIGRQQLSIPGVTAKSTYRISVADLPKGIYLVALRLENGRTVTKKLLKQ